MNAHQLDADGVILNTIVVDSLTVFPHLVSASIGGSIGDKVVNGAVVPKPTAAPTIGQYTAAIQAMLDAKAQERHYDNILSACTYVTSTNATFHAEGQACVQWRDAAWAKSYDLMAQVQAGTLAQPTIPALLAMLPAMVWPA